MSGDMHIEGSSSKRGAKSVVAAAHSLVSASAAGVSLAAGSPKEAVRYNTAAYPTSSEGPLCTDWHLFTLTIQKTNLSLPQRSQ